MFASNAFYTLDKNNKLTIINQVLNQQSWNFPHCVFIIFTYLNAMTCFVGVFEEQLKSWKNLSDSVRINH